MSFASNYSLFSLKFRTVLIAAAGSVVVVTPIVSLISQSSNINFSGASSSFSIVGTGFDWLKTNFQSGIEKIPKKVQGVWIYLSPWSTISTIFNLSILQSWFSLVRTQIEFVYSTISEVIKRISSVFLDLWSSIISWTPTIWLWVSTGAVGIYSLFIQTIFPYLKNFFSDFQISEIKKKLEELLKDASFASFKEDLMKIFKQFISNPFETLRSFLISIYENVFKIFFRISFAFIDSAIDGTSYQELLKFLKQTDKLHNALTQIMKFFQKYRNYIVNISYETIKKLVKLFLQNPEDFIKKLKKLLENKSFLYSGDLVSLLSKRESEITALIAANDLKQTIKKVTEEGLNLLEQGGKSLEKSIFNGNTEPNSISSEVRKIADPVVSITTDILENIFSSLWSLGFGSNNKKED